MNAYKTVSKVQELEMAFSRLIRSLFLAMLMIASSSMITHKALVDAGLSVLRRK
jgi:hypothetical protein